MVRLRYQQAYKDFCVASHCFAPAYARFMADAIAMRPGLADAAAEKEFNLKVLRCASAALKEVPGMLLQALFVDLALTYMDINLKICVIILTYT